MESRILHIPKIRDDIPPMDEEATRNMLTRNSKLLLKSQRPGDREAALRLISEHNLDVSEQ